MWMNYTNDKVGLYKYDIHLTPGLAEVSPTLLS